MKFSVSSSALLSLLATTGKVISNKNTLPILDYFLMELKGDQLKVTTSDLETTLVGQITVDNVESEGMIAAPAKQLLDSLKEFAEIPLTIDCNDQTFEIKLNWKSGSLSIPGASAVSYPALPALAEDKKELTFDVDTLVNGINKTIFATADDELRPIMNSFVPWKIVRPPPGPISCFPSGKPFGRSGIIPPSYQCTSTSGKATFGILSRAGKIIFTCWA